MSTQINSQKHFYFKLFSLFKQLYITIQFSASTIDISVNWNTKSLMQILYSRP